LLFLFLARATDDWKPAAFTAALFALHPVHVESVAWIAERKDVLSGLFFMLALLAYLRYVRAACRGARYRAYLTTLPLFVLGLLAKPTLVTFPFVLLLLDYWPLRRTTGRRGNVPPGDASSISWKSLTIEKIPMLICSVGASVATYLAQKAGGAIADGYNLPPLQRAGNALLSYCRYLGKFLWPSHLSVFYPQIKDLPMESVVISAALVVAITLFGFWACKRAPFFIVGWLFFAGMLVPMLGIVQVGGQSMADRYLYLPMIGLSIICAWGAQRVVEFLGNARWVRGIATAGSIAVLVLLTAVTVNQLRYWHDTRMLFEHALDVTTDNALANIQLGYLDARMGDVAGARRYYEEAIRIEPTYFVAEFDLANLLLNNHQPQLAVAHYQKAFQNRAEVTPLGIAKLENNWGIALLELQKPGEAFEHFREAEQSDPDLPDAHFNLGQLFLRAARWNAAEEEFQRTLQLAPNHAGALRGLDAIRAGRASAPG